MSVLKKKKAIVTPTFSRTRDAYATTRCVMQVHCAILAVRDSRKSPVLFGTAIVIVVVEVLRAARQTDRALRAGDRLLADVPTFRYLHRKNAKTA